MTSCSYPWLGWEVLDPTLDGDDVDERRRWVMVDVVDKSQGWSEVEATDGHDTSVRSVGATNQLMMSCLMGLGCEQTQTRRPRRGGRPEGSGGDWKDRAVKQVGGGGDGM